GQYATAAFQIREDEEEKQSNRLTLDLLRDWLAKEGEDNTFLKHEVSARMVVDNKNVDIAALVIMPKYKMDLAKSHKALMQQRLDLALSCVVENGEAAFREALGNSGVWSFSMHKKLMYRFTALYVLETGEVVDEHPHFVQSSCSEHAFFFKGVL
ncbi:unnamed protein product, partial [Symbiodinium necroappetens]